MGNSYVDELNEIARDSNGKLKKLTEFQLRNVREEGKFSVESINFEGQNHVWELNRLLQMGKKNVEVAFHKELAVALALIIISIPHRIYSNLISIKYGFKSIYDGIIKFPHLLFGVSSQNNKYSEGEIDNILYKYRQEFILTHLLPIKDNLICMKEDSYYTSDTTKEYWAPMWREPISKMILDFRLYDSNVKSKIMPILSKLLMESRNYISKNEVEIRKQLFEELSSKYSTEKEIYQNIEDSLVEMENNLFISKVNESEKLKGVCDPDITNRILTNLHAFQIVTKIKNEIQLEKEEFEKLTRSSIISKYPVRSKIKEWVEKEVSKKLSEYDTQHKWDLHNKLEQLFYSKGYLQEAFIVSKDSEYRKLYEEDKRKELQSEKVASRTYDIQRPIINPKNWIIEKNDYSYYSVDYKVSQVTSSHNFWRWSLLAHRTRSIFKYSIGIFIYTIWVSRLGIRGLFSPNKYYPFKKVDVNTGDLLTDLNRPVHSLSSALKYIWTDIRSSIKQFEAQKDDGLLGKSVSRIFHRIWNYGFKGIIGSSAILIIQPILTLLNLTVSIPLLLLSPLYSPILAFLVYLTSIWIYDFDSPNFTTTNLFPMILSVIAKIGVTGIGQIVLSLLAILVIHPLSSFAVLTYATTTTCFRRIYDTFMYYGVLRSRARVPARDTFLARRISGPGLSNAYFYQVEENSALIALQAYLESMEVDYFRDYSQIKITEPQSNFTAWYHSTVNPIGAQSGYHKLFNTLENRKNYLMTSLNNAIYEHKKRVQLRNSENLNFGGRSIRMTSKDLTSFLSSAQALIENFAPKLFAWKEEDLFWRQYTLENNDWNGLTLLLVKNIFSEVKVKPFLILIFIGIFNTIRRN